MKIAIYFYCEWVLHDDLMAGKLIIDGKGGVYGLVGSAMKLSQTHYATVKKLLMRQLIVSQKVQHMNLFAKQPKKIPQSRSIQHH